MSLAQPQPLKDSDRLPYSDGQPMETTAHHLQMDLLTYPVRRWLQDRQKVAYVAGNNFLYYDRGGRGRRPRFVGPDFYVVLGRADTGQLSYVVWEEEGRYPDVIIELTSKTTEKVDRGSKFLLYRDVFQTPEYFLYHPLTRHFEGFRREDGQYQPLRAGTDGTLACQTLGLGLRVVGGWLRWLDQDGQVLLTGDERALVEQAKAEEEARKAEDERRKAEDERHQAQVERARADAAEAEIKRLRAQLEGRPPA